MDQKKINKINALDTICDDKWNYAVFNLSQSNFQSCCHSPNNIVTDTELQEKGIDAFLNSDHTLKSRYELATGIQTNDCRKCWKLEENNGPSYRTSHTQFWKHLQKDGFVNQNEEFDTTTLQLKLDQVTDYLHPMLKSNKPTKLEIRFNNTCDLKCMYCNYNLSSQWAVESFQYNEISEDQYKKSIKGPSEIVIEKFWEWFNAVGRYSIEKIGITGGEPLIMPMLYDFLEKLLNQINEVSHLRTSKLIIWMVTNLNTPAAYFEKFIKYLPKLTSRCELRLWISMETLGTKAEYIRNGLIWNRFENNLKNILSCGVSNLKIGFNIAHNVLSISSIKEVIEYIEFLYQQYKVPLLLGQSYVVFPNWQDPINLTPDFANYLDDTISHMKKYMYQKPTGYVYSYISYITYLTTISNSIRNNTSNNTNQRKSFVSWYNTYDQRRNLNLLETFPEYKNFYDFCVKL